MDKQSEWVDGGAMNKPIKCVFTIRRLTGGGAERVVSVLASAMVQKGIDTYIVVYGRTEKDYSLDEKVKIITMPQRKDSVLTKLKRVSDMKKILKEIKPDVVIPFVGTVLYVTWLACCGLKTKFVLTVRNNPWIVPETKKQRWLRDRIANKSDAVMIQNEEQRDYFPPSLKEKLLVINNPLSEVFIRNQKSHYTDSVHSIVTLGRLEPQKDHDFMIRSFMKAFPDQPDIKLYIYGEGRQKQHIEDLITQSGWQDRVLLMGRTTDALAVLQQCDLFVMTSRYEGMPNALMEAMAVGVPCISSDCRTGPKSMIVHRDNGILYSCDNEDDFVEQLHWAADHPQQLVSIGKKARQFMIEHYTEQHTAESIHKICERLKFDYE